jgi:hypothetical protein
MQKPTSFQPLPALLAILLAAIFVGLPASGQTVSLQAKQATLREVLTQLSQQTGYEFRMAVGQEVEEAHHDVAWKEARLAPVLEELSKTFKCDFFCVDATGFFVVPAPRVVEKETQVGAYRLRALPPSPTEEEGVLQLTLIFAAPDDAQMDAIAGLGGELRAVDSFGRELIGTAVPGLRSTSAPRVRLSEYWYRLMLRPRDDRAGRIRSVDGNLALYRKVTPLRFEFPLDRPEQTHTVVQHGVDFRLEKVTRAGDQYTVAARLAWAESRNVIGQGISRTPQPYLVDQKGKVYRDTRLRLSRVREPNGALVSEQVARFEEVESAPVKLVYEVLLREEPEIRIPFRLTDIPLPGKARAGAEREGGPFYAPDGGTLVLVVTDRDGKPVEAEVSLGISRKEGEAWSGWRWIEAITGPDGRLRVDHLRPGTYRLNPVVRLDPEEAPVTGGGSPVEATITAKKETALPPLKLPVQVPPVERENEPR